MPNIITETPSQVNNYVLIVLKPFLSDPKNANRLKLGPTQLNPTESEAIRTLHGRVTNGSRRIAIARVCMTSRPTHIGNFHFPV